MACCEQRAVLFIGAPRRTRGAGTDSAAIASTWDVLLSDGISLGWDKETIPTLVI